MGMATFNFKEIGQSTQSNAEIVAGALKQARARAISTTKAYVVQASDYTNLEVMYADSCSDLTFTTEDALGLELGQGAEFTSETWSVCFNARGTSDTNAVIEVLNLEGNSSRVEVMLGGAVRVS